jgi:hypothetical protein
MDGTSVSSTAEIGTNPGASWHVKGTADLNGDDMSDILWAEQFQPGHGLADERQKRPVQRRDRSQSRLELAPDWHRRVNPAYQSPICTRIDRQAGQLPGPVRRVNPKSLKSRPR